MWADLAIQCAPEVSVVTVERIIQVESKGDPLALNVNRSKVKLSLPRDAAHAASLAGEWIAKGFSVDLGLMQINSRNLPKLGLTVEQVLDPCTNIRAGATILSASYAAAARTLGPGQKALQAALSAYNTGTMHGGFENGYVSRYYDSVATNSSEIASKRQEKATKSQGYNIYTVKAATWPAS